VKAWLARAAAITVLRGEGRTRIARWARWFRRASPVPDSAFQGSDEPYPGHWRHLPEPWPPAVAADPAVGQRLREALDELPVTWRAVVHRHDIAGQPSEDVAHELGITVEQQRRILTMARAALRDQLADPLSRGERK
jgi:DNA-directed RNA polymerase specialized sigma24 family protein